MSIATVSPDSTRLVRFAGKVGGIQGWAQCDVLFTVRGFESLCPHVKHNRPRRGRTLQIPQFRMACPDSRALVRIRNPTYEREGLLFAPCACQWDWFEVPYVDSVICDHVNSLCPYCQANWYEECNIRFVSVADPNLVTDFDELARRWRAEQGIPEPPLSEYYFR